MLSFLTGALNYKDAFLQMAVKVHAGTYALRAVTFSVTPAAECNQILHYIPAESASGPDVMNLQVLHSATLLAAPTISFQDLVS